MKSVSATEAKNRLGALIGEAVDRHEDVVIENHGRPLAVLVSYERYQELYGAREQQQRRDALEDLRKLREEVRARNLDLDEAAADAIAEEISREAIARIIERSRAAKADQTR